MNLEVNVTKDKCELNRDQIVECILIKLSINVAYDMRMNPIDFRGQRSKGKVIISKRLYNLMNTRSKGSVYFDPTWHKCCLW